MNSAAERKRQSETKLRDLGIPINENLPLTEDEEEVKLRNLEEIVDRIIALTVASAKAMGASKEEIDEFIESYRASELFSMEESKFISKKKPSQRDLITHSWKIECVWVLLWSINLIEDDLNLPSVTCDVDLVYGTVLNSTREELINKSSLRTTDDVLDNLDLIYRIHWAVRDAQINDKEIPENLNEGVVYERHYALNWLVNYMEEEWDNVSTDT